MSRVATIASIVLSLAACSSEGATPAQDPGVGSRGPEDAAPDTNPYGVAYPTAMPTSAGPSGRIARR